MKLFEIKFHSQRISLKISILFTLNPLISVALLSNLVNDHFPDQQPIVAYTEMVNTNGVEPLSKSLLGAPNGRIVMSN